MPTLLTDVRLALRSLGKSPLFSAVALLTIALGVGANSAVFSVVNAVMLQPLPFADPDRLVSLYETARRTEVERRSNSYPNFEAWQRETRSFARMSAASGSRFTLRIGDVPERLDGELVSGSYFETLGAAPARGRGFTADDDRQGVPAVVVLSDALWERAFARDPNVIGRAIRVDGELCTIVGVMPPGFAGVTDAAQLWAPIARMSPAALLASRDDRWMDFVIARLGPGVTAEQARQELTALATRIDKQHPSAAGERSADLVALRDEFVGQMRPMLLVLLGAVGFVLLIACVNVANLLLARGSARSRELAVRCALGARRGRIVRQLLTESVTLSLLGGAAGLIAAFWSIDLLVALSPVPFPTFVHIGVDAAVLGFTFAVCVASGIVFGLAPALMASRTDLLATLRTGRDERAGSVRLRQALVTAEIALALVLLVGAGLMLRTMESLQAVDPGFRPAGLVSLRLVLPPASGDADAASAEAARFAQTVLERVQALPLVRDASLASDVPMGTSASATIARLEGRDAPPIRIFRHQVSPGHFRTLGVPLLAGRDFTAADSRDGGGHVAIVSKTMAERHWPDGGALHQVLRAGGRTFEVVGVVGDVKHRQLLEAASADPDVYFPLYQLPARAFAVLARTSGPIDPLVNAIRSEVRALDASVPIFQVTTGDTLLASQVSRQRFSSVLLGAFALVALALTLVGIYGVTAYAVSRQTRQVGLRMALGATRGDVLRLVLAGGAGFILLGLAGGTLAALALTRLLASLIHGVSPTDPTTFAVVTTLLAAVALLACLIPAARATRIDPAVALRSD